MRNDRLFDSLVFCICLSLAVGIVPVRAEINETIVVVGSRTDRSINEVASVISVKTAEDIERELARDIADLVRFEPGVNVGGTGDRFGLGGFNIRGIEGNRVLTLVDGVRVAEEFSFGPFLSARRDFIDIDSLQRAEIARGPISSLYGSDALGGVVAFTTKGPRDFIKDTDDTYTSVKVGYSGADSSRIGSMTTAIGFDGVSAMLMYTKRSGNETRSDGSLGGFGLSREKADPQSVQTDNVIAKVSFDLSDAHEIAFALERYKNETNTNILSDYGTLSRGTLVNTRDASDQKDRNQFTITYNYNGGLPFADEVSLTAYKQSSNTEQTTVELRTTPSQIAQRRTRDSFFEQDITGLASQLGKSFSWAGSNHFLTYGLDYYETQSRTLRNGGTIDALTGSPVFEFSPLPTRDFPLSKVTQFGFFLQDEIQFLDGQLLLSPSLRYDSYDADVEADAIYLSGNPGVEAPLGFDESEATGKVGVVYSVNDELSLFGQYSQGFRAPPYDDVNVGFSNFIGGYKTISNASLESETSEGWELGFRFQSRSGFLNLSIFRNDYKNFIESLTIAPQFLSSFGVDPADGLLTFQSINLSEVVIDGVEISSEVDLSNLLGLQSRGLFLKGALAYASGKNKTNSLPLNSVEPLTGVLGVSYYSGTGKWGADIVWTLVKGKKEGDIDPSDSRSSTTGYGILDLLVSYKFTEKVNLNFGIFNLTNKDYIRWADTVAIGADAAGRFSQPPLNASVTLRAEI